MALDCVRGEEAGTEGGVDVLLGGLSFAGRGIVFVGFSLHFGVILGLLTCGFGIVRLALEAAKNFRKCCATRGLAFGMLGPSRMSSSVQQAIDGDLIQRIEGLSFKGRSICAAIAHSCPALNAI